MEREWVISRDYGGWSVNWKGKRRRAGAVYALFTEIYSLSSYSFRLGKQDWKVRNSFVRSFRFGWFAFTLSSMEDVSRNFELTRGTDLLRCSDASRRKTSHHRGSPTPMASRLQDLPSIRLLSSEADRALSESSTGISSELTRVLTFAANFRLLAGQFLFFRTYFRTSWSETLRSSRE